MQIKAGDGTVIMSEVYRATRDTLPPGKVWFINKISPGPAYQSNPQQVSPSFKVWRQPLVAMWEEGNIGVGSSFIPRADQIAADFPLWVWPMGVLETSGQNCTAKHRRQWLSESGSLIMRSSLVRQLNHGVPCPLPHRSSGNQRTCKFSNTRKTFFPFESFSCPCTASLKR